MLWDIREPTGHGLNLQTAFVRSGPTGHAMGFEPKWLHEGIFEERNETPVGLWFEPGSATKRGKPF
eukprot:1630214-Pyramimonas_sp.AAC.1